MSIDVGGWIEVRTPGTSAWQGIERLNSYIDRANGMLDILFGRGDSYPFEPIAPGRGVPADASPEVRQDIATGEATEARNDTTGETSVNWITWAEIAAIDWDERAESSYMRYIPTKRGHLMRDLEGERQHRARFQEVLDRLGGWPEGADDLEVDGAIYCRTLGMKRSEVKGEDWRLLFAKLEKLAAQYGPEGARIVVWLVA